VDGRKLSGVPGPGILEGRMLRDEGGYGFVTRPDVIGCCIIAGHPVEGNQAVRHEVGDALNDCFETGLSG
jgi:hypothetical protein